MICKNCGDNFEGNFCNNCGQSSNVSRIDFRYLIYEVPNSIFQLNRGVLYTVKKLSIRPGHTIREFIEGKRKFLYKPISYFIVLSAVYVLVNYLLGKNTFAADAITGVINGIDESEESSIKNIIDWTLQYQTYVTLLFVPLFSIASYLAFIKSGYNYFEHLVLNLYIKGQQLLIYLIFSFVISEDNILSMLPFLLSVAYNVWTYFQFFDTKKTPKKVLLILLNYVLVLLMIFVITVVVVFVVHLFR